jgi:hypothetical protein
MSGIYQYISTKLAQNSKGSFTMDSDLHAMKNRFLLEGEEGASRPWDLISSITKPLSGHTSCLWVDKRSSLVDRKCQLVLATFFWTRWPHFQCDFCDWDKSRFEYSGKLPRFEYRHRFQGDRLSLDWTDLRPRLWWPLDGAPGV